jgi:histidine triad (HIT) family protein
MADSCIICQIIEGSIASKKVYEDEEIIAFLDFNGAARGHTFIAPKKHFAIFEQIPDALITKIFSLSNKVSSALFETLGAHGTNIFITNGVSAGQTIAHFTVNVIPRKEGDGINLQWKPRQLSEEEMSTVELRVKGETKNIGVSGTTPIEKAAKKEEPRQAFESDEENYLWRSVNRRIS